MSRAAREFAQKHQVNLVLKGFRTLTAAPDGKVWVNPTGNPGMATGGTGDVLTGLIAGLVAQYRDRPMSEVAAAAVYLHGLAGDLVAKELGQASLIAGDLIGALPRAYKLLARVTSDEHMNHQSTSDSSDERRANYDVSYLARHSSLDHSSCPTGHPFA